MRDFIFDCQSFATVTFAAEPAASVSVFENSVLCVHAGHLTENFSEQLRSFQRR